MTDLTLTEALAEVKRWNERGRYWPGSPDQHDVINVILNAAASGALIPRADADLAVALVVERAAGEVPSGWTGEPHTSNMDWGPNVSIVAKRKIRALAPTDALAEVQKLRAERDGWMETAAMHLTAEQAFLSWLRAAGEHMRAEGVTVCDDGQDSGGVLAAKVPECAALLKARAEAAEARLAEVEAELDRLREAIKEATDPDFIWGAMDNVHYADTMLDDYAAAVSRAQRAALAKEAPR